MQKSLKSNERRRTWVHRTSKIEIQKGRPNNSDILQIGLPLEIRSPLFNLQKFQDSEKSTPDSERDHWKLLNNEEFGSIERLRLKYRTGSGPNNSDIPQNWLPLEIRSPLFNLQNFLDPEKSIPDSYTNDWNLMNDEGGVGWGGGGPYNWDILQICFDPEIRSPVFHISKFQDFNKSSPDSYRDYWNLMNDEEFGSILLLWLKYKRRGTK